MKANDSCVLSPNEPEEGEIVDDYELISSDEEAGMRERIRELEEKNAEIEKIENFSRSYDIERAARIPTDVSSISSTEFKTPKKRRKRHKNKDHKKKSCHHHHSSHRHHVITQNEKKTSRTRCKRREKLLKRKHDKYAYKDFSDKLALESPDSFNSSLSSSSPTDSDADASQRLAGSDEDTRNDDDYYHKQGIRDTLRLAVSRHRKNSTRQTKQNNCLKERLMRKDTAFTGNLFSVPTEEDDMPDNDVEVIKVVDDYDDDIETVEIFEPENDIQIVPDDSSDSLEEKELRLIALKSAVLKKHLDRKRRNAEAAYSPTDFDEMMTHEDKLADIEVVDLEEDDSQNACGTVSPIASPQLMLLDGQDDESTQMVDCKPVDMDIANSDSESCAVGNTDWSLEITHSIPFPPYPPNDRNLQYSYGGSDLFLNEFPLNSTNPPPPGVDDYEETKQPSMTFKKYQDSETQDMELDNEFEPIVSYPCNSSQNAEAEAVAVVEEDFKSNSNGQSLHSNPNEEDLQEEEEELALRALLLSKFQSPKNQKKASVVATETKETTNDLKTHTESSTRTLKPTEAILKEAVKRLQIHSQQETKQDTLQATNPLWRHQTASFSRKDEDFNDIPLPWNHHAVPIKTEIECFNEASMLWNPEQNIPENFLPFSQDHKEETKNFTSSALVSLQRKAKELKSHNETKQIARVHQTNETEAVNKCSMMNEMAMANNTETPIDKPPMDEDIKRRLQKLKNEILSATRMTILQSEEDSIQQAEFGKSEHPIMEEQLLEKTNCQMVEISNCPRTKENIIGTLQPEIEESNYALREVKPIENNSNDVVINVNKTTVDCSEQINGYVTNDLPPSSETDNPKPIKVNVENKSPTSTKTNMDNSDEISKDNTALKENNVNSVNKKIQKTITAIPDNVKSVQASKKVAKTLPNKTITLTKVKAKETKLVPNKSLPTSTTSAGTSLPIITVTTTTNTNTIKSTLPTYSVLRTTKIVKPNKVINRNIDTKRKVILIKSDQAAAPPPTKQLKIDASANHATPRRAVDTSRLITSMEQVKHMCNVAQLVISVQNSSNESSDEEWANCDSMSVYRPLAEYNDIASPLSLHLESPCLTPVRSNSPIDIAVNKEEKTSKRSPITAPSQSSSPKTPILVQSEKATPQTPNLKTPVAVRHLPASAQDEYRKLIHRMKMLENQRNKKETIGSQENKSRISTAIIETKTENETNSQAGIKPSLVKQVLLRNANKPNSNEGVVSKNSNESSPTPAKNHKANVLRSYESLYVKIGAGIVNNLDKSLRLVEDAKKAKVNKLKLEERLKELKAELEHLQTQHKEEEQKISRIYPTICSTNEIITSLKQKRSKVFKAAIGLGKTLKGDEYRLNNDLKQNITSKTKLLAEEIKLVNSLKAANVHKLVDVCRPSETEQKIKDEICREEMASVHLKETCVETISMSNDRNANEESSKQIEIGGTTEFQDTKELVACDTNKKECETTVTEQKTPTETEDFKEEHIEKDDVEVEDDDKSANKLVPSYISPLEHLRCNSDGPMDPNGVICPYDLMGNCEDVNCKYVHIAQKDNSESNPS